MDRPLIVAVTGSSGVIYTLEFIKDAVRERLIYLILSAKGKLVMNHELGIQFKTKEDLMAYFTHEELSRIEVFSNQDMMAPPASGTARCQEMVVLPCSMNTLAAIYAGISDNLILRAADVTMKENRKLILVPREMPFSSIHLRNMYKLSQMGVHILPANPGFYNNPKTLSDIVDFVVGKICDHLNISHSRYEPWGSQCTETIYE